MYIVWVRNPCILSIGAVFARDNCDTDFYRIRTLRVKERNNQVHIDPREAAVVP